MRDSLIFKIKKYIPKSFRKVLLKSFDFEGYREYSNRQSNPFANDPDEIIFENSPIKAAIVFSKTHYHKFWIAACRDLKVSYQIIYLERADWQEQVTKAKCDVILVWPDIYDTTTKVMQDERLRILDEEMQQTIYPSMKEIWLYENKRVQNYWLKAHGFKTSRTWVFYDKLEALKFLDSAKYPLVFKSNLGASASGVYIIQTKKEAISKAKRFLQDGYSLKGGKSKGKQKGSLYIQEYLPKVKEWRMVRIGDSYFGHGKDMKGQFHSGSGKANWDIPSKKAFEILHDITEKGKFTSMDVDLFEDSDGNFYVNELQTVFGNSIAVEQLKLDGVPGRMLRDEQGNFNFEAGSFCVNHLCNLRLEYIIAKIRYE